MLLINRRSLGGGEIAVTGEVANESAATGEVIYLTRDGRRLAAIVPVEVAAEIEAAEDAADIAAAEAAMAEPGQDVPAEAVWA